MYFVATAPTGPEGRVNVSPKGYRDTFAVLDDTTVGYLDLTAAAWRRSPTCARTAG